MTSIGSEEVLNISRNSESGKGAFPMKPKICIPVAAGGFGQIRKQSGLIAARAPDFIEFRADYLINPRVFNILRAIDIIKEDNKTTPVIFTLRSKKEGGFCALAKNKRVKIINGVLDAGSCAVCDIEASLGSDVLKLAERAKENGVSTIISYHNFKTCPSEKAIVKIWKKALAARPDYIKIAVTAKNYACLNILSGALRKTARGAPGLILIAMGSAGVITRVAGSAITFAPVSGKTAPGQLPYDKLKSMLTRIYGR